MARSRVGGTSGLLSGKLGSVIYSITRNSDGSFRQVIGSNPESRFNPNTFDQARARCTMATIERAMFTFADFVTTGWEGVPPGTLSVSEFSRANYDYLAEYLKVMFDDDSDYDVHWDLPKKGQTQPRDGNFILAQGTVRPRWNWNIDGVIAMRPRWGIRSRSGLISNKFGDWMDYNGLHSNEQFVFIFFMAGRTPSLSRVVYVIVAPAMNANPNATINSTTFRNLLTIKGNYPCNVFYSNETNVLNIQFERGEEFGFKCCSSNAVRYRRIVGDKILYNNCELGANSDDPVTDYGWQGMRVVRPSWLNEE